MSKPSLAKTFSEEEDPEFQMAPMIDVVFQLLIFFMCVTTLQTVRVNQKVELPIAGASAKIEEGGVVINIEWQGGDKPPNVNINGQDMPYAQVTPFLRQLRDRNVADREKDRAVPEIRVMLRADKMVRYRQVRDVMDACSLAGIGRIAFITLQTEGRRPLP